MYTYLNTYTYYAYKYIYYIYIYIPGSARHAQISPVEGYRTSSRGGASSSTREGGDFFKGGA
jgi:hypothetical protein